MCGAFVNILCVQNVLSDILKATEEIHTITIHIEQIIWQKSQINTTLNNGLRYEINRLRSTFPTSKYHKKLLEMDNITKYDLIHLIKEERNAIHYLYNFVKILRNDSSIFRIEIDNLFYKIQSILQRRMICDYRNILYVYSENLLPIYHINNIQLLKTRKRELTSLAYDTYSIIIARLLRQWMDDINNFINNLENKLIYIDISSI